MATTMFQTGVNVCGANQANEANLCEANICEANVCEANEANLNVCQANEDYEEWLHEQNMDAEFDIVDYHTNKNKKMAQNVRDKKLTKPKEDEAQKELYKQKMKELEQAKQLKIQKTKDRKADEKLRILQRKDKQDVKDIGLDENQYGQQNEMGQQIDLETEALVKDNWDD
jgi:hypothetical protein